MAVSRLLRELVLALVDEPLLYDRAGRGGAIVSLIVSEIARAQRLPLVIPMPHDPRLRRVCARLLADPSDLRTLDGWSEIAGASARTLARLFDSELDLTFTAWRQRVRFHNALEAIARDEPIERIARDNGYRSPSAFAAAFRSVMGHAPTGSRPRRCPLTGINWRESCCRGRATAAVTIRALLPPGLICHGNLTSGRDAPDRARRSPNCAAIR